MKKINVAFEPVFKLILAQGLNPMIELPIFLGKTLSYDHVQLIGNMLPDAKFVWNKKLYVLQRCESADPCKECVLKADCERYQVVPGICLDKNATVHKLNFKEIKSTAYLESTAFNADNHCCNEYKIDGVKMTIKKNRNNTKSIVFNDADVVTMEQFKSEVTVKDNLSFEDLCPKYKSEHNSYDWISCVNRLNALARVMNLKYTTNSSGIINSEDLKFEILYDVEDNEFWVNNIDEASSSCSPKFVSKEAAQEVIDNPRLRYILDGAYK